jgi:hypothetical protein
MASFTLYLWEALEIENDPGDGSQMGLGAYPIPASWSDTDRAALNRKIVAHYWNREIGAETISLFRFRLTRKLNEIMPLYVQLYDSSALKYDPLSTYDLHTVRNDDTTENVTQGSTANATSTSTGKSRTASSSPPQGQLRPDGQYATNIVDVNSTNLGSSDSTSNNTTTGDSKLAASSSTTGRQGSANRLLAEYRSNILNIDLMILNELDELFLGIWDTDVEFLPERGEYSR